MKIGYTTWGMPQTPIDVSLAHLQQCGYRGVEIAVIQGFATELDGLDKTERRRIRRLVDELNLELPAVGGHQSLMSRDPDRHAENWRRLTGAADLCVDWASSSGPPVLVSVLGSAPGDFEASWDLMTERLATLTDYCRAQGVVLALEPHVGDGMTDPAKVVKLMEAIDSPHCRLNFDISHFDVEDYQIDPTVSALAPYAVNTHVKDQRGTVPDHQFMIPGEGDFDYATYLTAMDRADYQGYVTVEISVRVHRRPNYDPLIAAARSYQTLLAAFRQAGLDSG